MPLRKSRLAALGFWVLTGALPLIERAGVYGGSDLFVLNVILMATTAGLGAAWCVFDALEREIWIPSWLSIGVLLLAVVFVPVYLFRYRGWAEGAKSLLTIFAFFVLTIVASTAFESALF